jgi:hypothetical protein
MAEVKVGGVWLHSMGHVSAVKWSTTWGAGPSGSALASCEVAVDPSNDSSLLRINSAFEVWADGVKVFGGVLTEMGRGFPRSLSAVGWARRAGDFDAVDGSGNPTTNPNTAVTQAIANGLPWSNAAAFTSTTVGAAPAAPVRVSALLDEWGTTAGKRWGADVNGVAFASADPTTPTWMLDASDLDIGVATDGLYTRVRYRYATAVDSGGTPTATAGGVVNDTAGQALYGIIEYGMDLTGLGVLTAPTALSYATAQFAQLTVPQWLSRVTTNATRLLTLGGLDAHLPSVRAGQMVRLFNVPNSLGGLRNELGLDIVLGEVEYDSNNPAEITLAPVGLAVRNIVDMATQAKRAVDEASKAA